MAQFLRLHCLSCSQLRQLRFSRAVRDHYHPSGEAQAFPVSFSFMHIFALTIRRFCFPIVAEAKEPVCCDKFQPHDSRNRS